MKITCNKDVLLNTAAKAATCITRSALPVLNNILFVTDNNTVTMSGCDLTNRIDVKMECDVIHSGAAAIPANLLLKIGKAMSGKDVEIDVGENFHATVKCGKTVASLPCLKADDYPQVGTFEPVYSFRMSGKQFLNAINYGSYAYAANDASRKMLEGVCLQFDPTGKMTVVSTDGKRLAMHETLLPAESGKPDTLKTFILPATALAPLGDMLFDCKTDEIDTTVSFGEKQFQIENKTECFTCRLVEGTYPNYRQVIPQGSKHKIIVNAAELQQKVKMLSLIDEVNRNCNIRITNTNIELSATSQVNGSVKDEIELKEETGIDDPIEICLCTKYIVDCLTACRSLGDDTMILINDAMSPIELSFDLNSTSCIVMPLRKK